MPHWRTQEMSETTKEEGELSEDELVQTDSRVSRYNSDRHYSSRTSRLQHDRRGRQPARQPQRRQQRSRSRSWTPDRSRSRSRTPVQGSFRDRQRRAISSLIDRINQQTDDVELKDCLTDLPSVCSRLSAALIAASDYLATVQDDSFGATASSAEFRSAAARILEGLHALTVMSSTGHGREMEAARGVLRQAWSTRQHVFTAEENREMDKWPLKSKNFQALLEEAPPPRPQPVRKAAPQAAAAPAAAVPSIPGFGTGLTDTGGRERERGSNGVDLPSALRSNGAGAVKKKAEARGQVAAAQEELRNPTVDRLISFGKLCLVLDLDHTLLHSIMYSELDQTTGERLESRAAAEMARPHNERMLFRMDNIQMYTKLRPGVHEFLRRASGKFELWIHTNGNKSYAAAVVPLLDPTGAYFGEIEDEENGRIIAQGAERQEDMQPDQPKTLLQHPGLKRRVRISLVVDDSHHVWQAHKESLVLIERYLYFPNFRNFKAPPSLMQQNKDDHLTSGILMVTLGVLERVHAAVFEALTAAPSAQNGGLPSWDVRRVLREERRRVLRGARIVFSGIIPLGQAPTDNELWKQAVEFGAECCTSLKHPGVTHLVAAKAGTEKALEAIAAGHIAVVSPGWLLSSCALWKRAEERMFTVAP